MVAHMTAHQIHAPPHTLVPIAVLGRILELLLEAINVECQEQAHALVVGHGTILQISVILQLFVMVVAMMLQLTSAKPL